MVATLAGNAPRTGSENFDSLEEAVSSVAIDPSLLDRVQKTQQPIVIFLADIIREHNGMERINSQSPQRFMPEFAVEGTPPEKTRFRIETEGGFLRDFIPEARELVQKMREGWETVQAFDSASNRFTQTKQPVTRRHFSKDDEFNLGLLKALKESADIHIKGMADPFDEAKKTLADLEKLRKEQETSGAPQDEELAQKVSNEKARVRKLLEKLEPWSNHISTDYAKNRVALGDMNTGQYLKSLPISHKGEGEAAPQRHIVIVGEEARRFFHEQFGIGEAVERAVAVQSR